MKQLTGLDASFLYMETPSSFGHVSGLGIYQRPADDPDFDAYEAFKAQIESRLDLLEPFRRRLVEVPMGLDHPWWINDPDFDIDFHVRHIAIPPPGSMEQLAAQVARIIGRPMDRSRPLWEAYVLEGLPDGKFAVLQKTHHATIDGAAGVEMLTMLLDSDPTGDEVPSTGAGWKADAVPTDLEMLNRTVMSFVQRPAKMARLQLKMIQQMADITRNKGLSNVVGAARDRVRGPRQDGTEQVLVPAAAAPRTPFNGSITPHRRLSLRSVELDLVKDIKNALGCTINDVVMAMCAGALRNYLLSHDALPAEPLQAMVPVSIRTGQEAEKWTNRVSGLVAALPTHVADPGERVLLSHQAMDAAKEQFELVPAEALVDVAQFSSPAVAVQAAQLASRMRFADRTNPAVNVVISNVPGPRTPLYLAGAQMLNYFPVSTIAEGMGLNITVHSYLDSLDIGLVACRELVPDLDVLVDLHVAELHVLAETAGVAKASAKKTAAKKTAAKKAPAKKAPARKRTAKKTAAAKK